MIRVEVHHAPVVNEETLQLLGRNLPIILSVSLSTEGVEGGNPAEADVEVRFEAVESGIMRPDLEITVLTDHNREREADLESVRLPAIAQWIGRSLPDWQTSHLSVNLVIRASAEYGPQPRSAVDFRLLFGGHTGKLVELRLDDGSMIQGQIIAVDDDRVVLEHEPTGPRNDIMSGFERGKIRTFNFLPGHRRNPAA